VIESCLGWGRVENIPAPAKISCALQHAFGFRAQKVILVVLSEALNTVQKGQIETQGI